MFSAGALATQDVAEKKKELSEIRDRIKQINLNLERIRQKKERLQSQLATIEKKHGLIAIALRLLEEQADVVQRQLTETRQKIRQQRQDIDRQKNELIGQIRAAHATGRTERLKLLLSQEDPAVSSRMMIYYAYFNRARLAKLEEITSSLHRLNELERQQTGQSEQLQVLRQQKAAEQEALLHTKQQRQTLLAKLNQDQQTSEQQLTSLRETEQRLHRLIASIREVSEDFPVDVAPGKTFAQLKGQLPWPVRGKLLKRFGAKRSEVSWDGVVIAANEGDSIQAVGSGRIVYADWLRGYGLLTIIDHGNGYMTLYAFNQSLYKDVGDWVEPGDKIAAVGNSGGRSRAGLYFGIRKNGKPVDPVRWCKK